MDKDEKQVGKFPPSPSFATAIGQLDADNAKVIAQASGENVNNVLHLARTHDIPVVQDLALSTTLRKLPPGTLIPDNMFDSVSIVLKFLLKHEETLEAQTKNTMT